MSSFPFAYTHCVIRVSRSLKCLLSLHCVPIAKAAPLARVVCLRQCRSSLARRGFRRIVFVRRSLLRRSLAVIRRSASVCCRTCRLLCKAFALFFICTVFLCCSWLKLGAAVPRAPCAALRPLWFGSPRAAQCSLSRILPAPPSPQVPVLAPQSAARRLPRDFAPRSRVVSLSPRFSKLQQ